MLLINSIYCIMIYVLLGIRDLIFVEAGNKKKNKYVKIYKKVLEI